MARSKKETGLKIVLSVDSQQAIDESKKIQGGLKPLRQELREVEKQLQLEPNVKTFKKGMQLATQQVEETEKAVEALRKRIAELSKEDTDAAAEEIGVLQRQLKTAEKNAASAKEQLDRIAQTKLSAIKGDIDEANQKLQKLGNTLSVSVTAPLVAAGTAAFNYSADMAESLSKTEVVFGENAEAVKRWADTTLSQYGIANMTALEMASYFGDMGTAMGFTQAQAQEMSMALVGLAGDVASFKNMSLEDAQAALGGVFTGETESLKRLGVVMTEENLKAYALAEGFKTAYGEMSQAEKVSLRYSYVMETLSNAQGDFSRTQDSAANQVRTLQESLKQLAATFGDELTPMITPILENINELVKKFAALDEETKKNIVQAALAAATFGPLLKITSSLGTSIANGVMQIIAYTAAQKAQTATTTANTAAQTANNAVAAASPWGAIASAISLVISLLGSFIVSSALAGDSAKSSAQEIRESFEEAAASADKQAQASERELQWAEKQIEEFKKLNAVTEKTADQKLALKQIVEDINGVLPDAVKMIDTEAGAYYELSQNIEQVITSKRKQLEIDRNASKAKAAYNSLQDMVDEYGTVADVERHISLLQTQYQSMREASSEHGWFENLWSWMFTRENWETAAEEIWDELKETEKILRQMQEYEAELEKLGYGELDSAGGPTTKSIDEQVEEMVAGIPNAQKRAQVAAILREKLLTQMEEGTVSSSTEVDYLAQFQDFCSEVARLAQETADAKIDALDRELEAYDKLIESEKYEKQLAEARKKLEYERDEDNRRELEKYIAQLEKEQEEREFRDSIAAQKAQVQADLAAVQAQISDALSQATGMGSSTENAFYNTQTFNLSGMTVSQVSALINAQLTKFFGLV